MPTTVVKTVKPSGGDYTSLSAAEAGEQRDLVAADQIAAIECYSMVDTTEVLVSGYTTDATRYIDIYAPVTERHSGRRNNAKYILNVTNPSAGHSVLSVAQEFTRVRYLQLTGSVFNGSAFNSSVANNPIYGIGLLITDFQSQNESVRGGSQSGNEIHLINCIIANGQKGGVRLVSTSGTPKIYLYNCAIVNCGGATQPGVNCSSAVGYIYAYNTYSGGNAGGDYFVNNVGRAVFQNAMSADASAATYGGTGGIPLSIRNFINVTPGSEDLHLPQDSVFRGAGTDLSADPQWVNPDGAVDIDGHARPAGAWSVGPDQGATVITKTVKSSGGDYTSLQAWEAAMQADLVTNDQISQAECYAMLDTAPCDIAGWTTDASRYVRVYTPHSERHSGRRPTAANYRKETGLFQGPLNANVSWTRIEGIACKQTANSYPAFSGTGNGITFSDCLAYDTWHRGYGVNAGAGGSIRFLNCISISCGRGSAQSAFSNAGADGTVYYYNCVAIGSSQHGFQTDTRFSARFTHVKNCYAAGSAGSDYETTFGVTSFLNNYSADGTAGTTVAAFSLANFLNVTAGSEDLRLPTGSALIGVGTDLSADANWLHPEGNYGIDGTERVAPWDVGAFSYSPIIRVEVVAVDGNNATPGVGVANFATPTVAGELVVVRVHTGLVGNEPASVTDNLGQVYTKIWSQVVDAYNQSIWYKQGSAAGVNAITVTDAGLDAKLGVIAAHYRGIASASALDQSGGAPAQDIGPDFQSVAVTTTQADELVIGTDFGRYPGSGVNPSAATKIGGKLRQRASRASSPGFDGNNGNYLAYADGILRQVQTLRYEGTNPTNSGTRNYPGIVTFKAETGTPPTSVNFSDSGAGADTIAAAAALAAGEAGSGTDAAALVASPAAADSGTGAEGSSLLVSAAGTDTGVGLDASALAAALSAADNALGNDSFSTVVPGNPSFAEAGAAVDNFSVRVQLASIENGSGLDTSTTKFATAVADAGATADTAMLLANPVVQDSGISLDTFNAPVAKIGSLELVLGTDTGSVGHVSSVSADLGLGVDLFTAITGIFFGTIKTGRIASRGSSGRIDQSSRGRIERRII